MRDSRDWQGTAFLLWVICGVAVVFFLRHPLGREITTAPRGGAWLLLASIPAWIGWTLGWPNKIRWVALGTVAALAIVCAIARLDGSFGVGLLLVTLAAYAASPLLSPGQFKLPQIPRFSPRRGKNQRADLERSLPEEVEPPHYYARNNADQEDCLLEVELPPLPPAIPPPWAELEWLPDEIEIDRPEAPPEDWPEQEEALPQQVSAAAEERAAASTDTAAGLAAAVLALLEEDGVDAPLLHLQSSPGRSVTLELDVTDSRQGKRLARMRPTFTERLGVAPDEVLRGQMLQLSFPAHTRGNGRPTSASPLWIPLGQTDNGERFLLNLATAGSLLLVGDDVAAITATMHTIACAALGGTLNVRPHLLLAEESGQDLHPYTELGGVEYFSGPDATEAIKQRIYDRGIEEQATRTPTLALILLPSAEMQRQIAESALSTLGPAVGIYLVLAVHSSQIWDVQTLAGSSQSRLVFRVGEDLSRALLSRYGAEDLADFQAIYHLSGMSRQPTALRTYDTGASDVRALLDALSENTRKGGPDEATTR